MNNRGFRKRGWRVVMALAVGGSAFQLGSCDPTVRTTLLAGLATTTESLLDTLVQTFFTSLANDASAGGGSSGLTTT